jgi:hypothetical protein
MRDLGLVGHPSWEKFVPDEYKFASIEDRLPGQVPDQRHRPTDEYVLACKADRYVFSQKHGPAASPVMRVPLLCARGAVTVPQLEPDLNPHGPELRKPAVPDCA